MAKWQAFVGVEVCVCTGLNVRTEVCTQGFGWKEEGVWTARPGWLPVMSCSGAFQVSNEIVFVKIGGWNKIYAAPCQLAL